MVIITKPVEMLKKIQKYRDSMILESDEELIFDDIQQIIVSYMDSYTYVELEN